MKIIPSSNYVLFKAEENFSYFVTQFKKAFLEHERLHFILDLSDIEILEKELFILKSFAEINDENGYSFIIVIPLFDADIIDEGINVVPSIKEAEDFIHMNEIARSL